MKTTHGAARKRKGANRNAQKRHELLQELASNDEAASDFSNCNSTWRPPRCFRISGAEGLLDPQFYDIAINEHPSENDEGN